MRILLGTDILLYYLQKQELVDGMTMMFKWIERIGATKYADISSVAILTHFTSLDSFDNLKQYQILKQIHPLSENIERVIEQLSTKYDSIGVKYKPLLAQLNWLFYDDVECLITENSLCHELAQTLCVDDRVFTIEEFIEKCSLEYSEYDETKGVAISVKDFESLDFNDSFFDSFKAEYEPYYHVWLQKKAKDKVYVANDDTGAIRGLLKLKVESATEDYGNIVPAFKAKKRLKISSLKADYTSQKLGQRFMRIIFDTAIKEHVEEIYVTVVAKGGSRLRLINMVEQWGFVFHGTKDGKEHVYVRDFRRILQEDPKKCFPYQNVRNGAYIVPIYRSYASQLLPQFGINVDNSNVEPNKQAIKKVVILHEDAEQMKEGSTLLFFQKSDDPGYRNMIGVGIVENVYRDFNTEFQFVNRCRKRSLLNNNSLHDCWERAAEKPIVVEFLYAHYFEEYITVTMLESIGITVNNLHSQCPYQITPEQFNKLVKDTLYAKTIVID